MRCLFSMNGGVMVSSSHDPAMLSPGGGPLIDHKSRRALPMDPEGTNKVPELVA